MVNDEIKIKVKKPPWDPLNKNVQVEHPRGRTLPKRIQVVMKSTPERPVEQSVDNQGIAYRWCDLLSIVF